ncbi:hypothetical protein GCM10011326_48290 [Salipiger profundus]|nr:hypothetical protein GCM10011326_48290 [Salipiger profundus]
MTNGLDQVYRPERPNYKAQKICGHNEANAARAHPFETSAHPKKCTLQPVAKEKHGHRDQQWRNLIDRRSEGDGTRRCSRLMAHKTSETL